MVVKTGCFIIMHLQLQLQLQLPLGIGRGSRCMMVVILSH